MSTITIDLETYGFPWALRQLKAGKAVKRKGNPKVVFLPNARLYILSMADMDATDWILA